jgi:hypothetical protein
MEPRKHHVLISTPIRPQRRHVTVARTAFPFPYEKLGARGFDIRLFHFRGSLKEGWMDGAIALGFEPCACAVMRS